MSSNKGRASILHKSGSNPRASTIQGHKHTVNFCVIPASVAGGTHSGDTANISNSHRLSFAPKRLFDIECGNSILVTEQQFLDQGRFQELDSKGALVVTARSTAPIAKKDATFFAERKDGLLHKIARGDVRGFDDNNEAGGVIGRAWRGALLHVMMAGNDEVNRLLLSRALNFFLPFQSAHESYIISEINETMDSGRKKDTRFVLGVAFRNRNISRIIVRLLGPRWDFLWHTNTMVTWHRLFDMWGQIPIVGITSFPGSENFVSTRAFAQNSIFRVVLGRGNWFTRVVTRGRQGLLTDDPNNVAQNLAAESNGFEASNRAQFGTYNGRLKTNAFRLSHRLPTDESVVRTFVASPSSTLLNNGVEHVIRQLAKHWHNMLYQPSGNFAHQRMEQLTPFETLRFHMPIVLTTMATLRGRNKWDAHVLGPFISRLQSLKPAFAADAARALVRELKDDIIVNVSGGIASRVDPFQSWADAILQALDQVEAEAKLVYEVVSSVEIGIRLGHDIVTQTTWKVPSDRVLKKAVLAHVRGQPTGEVNQQRIRTALTLITPRDKRTFIELVNSGLAHTKPAKLLLSRAVTLLQRELRREYLNDVFKQLSKGDIVKQCEKDEWYVLEKADGTSYVYIYDGKVTGKDMHKFVHVDTRNEEFIALSDSSVTVRNYIPVAEAVTRAQRAYMHIELDLGKKFSYFSFMEFSYLRTALRRLAVVGQVACEELDNARLNILAEIQRSNQVQVSIYDLEPGRTYYKFNSALRSYDPFVCEKKYTAEDPEWAELAPTKFVKVPPQNTIVIGGGPTGLMATLHFAENVLASGGNLRLYEARDAFTKAGSTFERAQIVRLDARWIAMLRYHLGTGYEDVYIPASGETGSQLGNTLPSQGFVEITIKDLENMLHVEVSKMNSKGLINHTAGSGASYDADTNSLTKQGQNLKNDDLILRRVDADGNPTEEYHTWKVVDLDYTKPLSADELLIGEEYGVYIRVEDKIVTHKLVSIDLTTNDYTFAPKANSSRKELRISSLDLNKGVEGESLKASGSSLPTVYPKGTTKHGDVNKVTLECVERNSDGSYTRDDIPFGKIKKTKFTIDVGHTHVFEAIGKPHGSKVHFCATTHEPYGTCCIQGIKISMGMHNFGNKRWGAGLIDDIRSQTDQNTRVVGDFTKMVRSPPIVERMWKSMTDKKDNNWQRHFNKLVDESEFAELNVLGPIVPKIQRACRELADEAPTFRRQTLQTRFFETGDNYYLGMEFNREYDRWKESLGTELVAPLLMKAKDDDSRKKVGNFRGVLMHHIDRLWYDGCMEVIRTGDVYNPGARARVPRIYLVDMVDETTLGKLPVGESFRLVENPKEKYEVLVAKATQVVVRNVEGFISKMSKKTRVRLGGNLTRGPDGNTESRVSITTFPVAHYINFRTMRLNNTERGYVFAFGGDEQSSPHFMRYSGLTGACINVMLFNNFIKEAFEGIPFQDRFRLYSRETNWSNGEVVQRGTGANYGEDGFLRPGFSYDHGLDYLHSKVIEYRESDQDLNEILSRDWKVKFAAALVPRGMETNEMFIKALNQKLVDGIMNNFIKEATKDKDLAGRDLESALKGRSEEAVVERTLDDYDAFWSEYMSELEVDEESKKILEDRYVLVARRLEQTCMQVIKFAEEYYLYNQRVSSEMFNQPKPVDTIYDDFAPEAQNFANSLAMAASFSSGALAFRLIGVSLGSVFSALIAGLNIAVSFGTMANSARYQIRNEEARVDFFDSKMTSVKQGVYSLVGIGESDSNPFVRSIEMKKEAFIANVKYYDYPEPDEFLNDYGQFMADASNIKNTQWFMDQIAMKYIADIYHVNSYLQEHLVKLYKACDEHKMNLEASGKSGSSNGAESLYQRLVDFEPRLLNDLERRAVRGGFIRRRHFSHWTFVVVLKYFYGLFCCARKNGRTPLAPLSIEILGILKQAQDVTKGEKGLAVRATRDLSHLYWATKESEVGSLVFSAGVLVFIASILFTIARIFRITVLEQVAFWATAASFWGALLSLFHFTRKMRYLFSVYFAVGKKVGQRGMAATDVRDSLKRVRKITRTQIFLTFLRVLFTGGAAVALPWSVVELQWGGPNAVSSVDRTITGPSVPFWIAFGSVVLAVFSTLTFFFVEYKVRYNLPSKLGEFVCEGFRDELEELYEQFSLPVNNVQTKQVQERETWEYVAREFLHRYRFDTVFAADRFGTILQYIQSGLQPRDNEKNQVVTLVTGV